MGRGNEFAVTEVMHGPDHNNRRFQIRCPIVNSRNQMIVHICHKAGKICRLVLLSS